MSSLPATKSSTALKAVQHWRGEHPGHPSPWDDRLPWTPFMGRCFETRDVFSGPASSLQDVFRTTACFGVLVLNDAGWGFEHVLNTISKDDDSYASLTIALPNNPLVCGRIHIYLTSSNLSWFLTFSRKESVSSLTMSSCIVFLLLRMLSTNRWVARSFAAQE